MTNRHFFPMDGGAPDGGAAALPAPADAAPAAAPAAGPAAAPPAPAGRSLMERAGVPAPVQGGDPATVAAGAVAAAAATDAGIPDKFIVKAEDGSIDYQATAIKMANDGYRPLEKRLGAGDAPPKTPDDYAPVVPAGLKLEDLKADPLYAGFLKGAHARGMTNAHVSYVLEAMGQREAMRNSEAQAEAELRKDYPSDDELTRVLSHSYRATAAYAGGDEAMAKLSAKFGNDPDFIRLMAKIGATLQEDRPPEGGLNESEAMTLEAIYKHPGYFDSSHPEHGKLVAQAKQINYKRTGGA